VSPENILVTREGTAKIADFGVATARGHVGVITGETDLGRARGKVWYMAPEELWGEEVDRRADLFALGVVLYRMTTGRHPFGSENGRESVRRLLAGAQAVRPTSFVPDYPAGLEALLMSALSERPDGRPATAREFRQALFKAVPPASEDDVAQFLADLFSGRRLERDERLRLAIDQRGPLSLKPVKHEESPEVERSDFREASRPLVSRFHAAAVGVGVVGVGIASLALLSFVGREGAPGALPTLDANTVAATVEPVSASKAPPELTSEPSPTMAVRTDPPRAEEGPTPSKNRPEKPLVDVSPVREVGF
jgi:serine/threonine-protein kinase